MNEETKGRVILLKSQIPKVVKFLETENVVAHTGTRGMKTGCIVQWGCSFD